MRKVRERKHRLSRERYGGRITAAFTICVLGKRKIFIDENVYCEVKKILLNALDNQECEAHVYLFMPDHAHLLLQGKMNESDLWKCVVNFKQLSGYWLSKNRFEGKWQKDFFDHILRKDEDVIKQVKYILQNPVRKGLVKNWRDYRFKGSTIYNFQEW